MDFVKPVLSVSFSAKYLLKMYLGTRRRYFRGIATDKHPQIPVEQTAGISCASSVFRCGMLFVSASYDEKNAWEMDSGNEKGTVLRAV